MTDDLPDAARTFSGGSAEWTLLLQSLRLALHADAVHDAGPGTLPSIDWRRLIGDALGHGVMPHLHVGLAKMPWLRRDRPLRAQLAAQFGQNSRLNLLRSAELVRVLDALEARSIDAMPVKGPALAVTVYGSLAMRQFSDIDVLVAEGDVPAAKATLIELGYDARVPEHTSLTFVRRIPGCQIAIDLQWAMAEERYACPMRVADLMERRIRVPFLNRTIWQPSLQDQLFLLCVHPAKHCWSRLGWVADLAMLIHAHARDLDWDAAMHDASRLGIRRQLLLGVTLADELCGAQVPAEVRAAAAADSTAGVLAQEIVRRLADTASLSRLNGSFGLVEAGLFHMRTRERMADKVPYLRYLVELCLTWWSLTPSDRDRRLIDLPPWLSFLYIPIRLVRQATQYGPRLLRWSVQAVTSLR